MRHSNHTGRGARLPIWTAGLFALIALGCAPAAVVSAPPTAEPTPVVTPDPHLREPVTADQVFRALSAARLGMIANNANTGGGNSDIVKMINADLGSWPLRITEYRSTAVLTRALAWKPRVAPGGDEAPYAFAGLNILIQFGPISARPPAPPDVSRQQAVASIIAVLDPLLWPLAQRSIVAVPTRTAIPSATPAPSAKPSTKPTTRPSAKATKAPSKAP